MARYPSSQTTDHDCHPNLWKLGGGLHKTWSRVCFYFGTCFLQFWGRLREGDVFQTAGSLMEETWTSVVVVVENASLGSLPAPSTPLTCPLFSSSSSYLGSLLSLHSIIDHAPPARIGPRPFFFLRRRICILISWFMSHWSHNFCTSRSKSSLMSVSCILVFSKKMLSSSLKI